MAFWTVAGVIAALTVLFLCRALWRGQDGAVVAETALYLRRATDLNRERARGLMDAAALRQGQRRLARQMLGADVLPCTPEPPLARLIAVGAVLTALGASIAIYAKIGAPGVSDQPVAARLAAAERLYQSRPDQATAEAVAAKLRPASRIDERTDALMRDLRETVAARPDDLRGHLLLAKSELSLGNYEAARKAQRQVIALRGTADDTADLGAIDVEAAGGVVTAQAEQAFRRALSQDAANGTALYYLGLMWAQNGRPDRTLPLWQHLPASSPFLAEVRRAMPALAAAAGTSLPALPESAR